MIRTIKPKNARSKRAMEKKQPKLVENVKSALFVPGHNSNKALHDITVDLSALKKPYEKRFNKKNSILPFDDASSIEFLSQKNDSSLVVLTTNNKKRPNTLTFIRTFNYEVYDMVELHVQQGYKLMTNFKTETFQLGLKPMFVFQGAIFESDPVYAQIKSLFLDFYRGEVAEFIDVAGLQGVIVVSAGEKEEETDKPLVHFRVYKLKTFHSPEPKLPRVELVETGPRLDFKVGRHQPATPEMEKEALKVSKKGQRRERKNVDTDMLGDTVATIHVGKQDLSRLQTRKMKGLKERYDQEEDADEIID